jgi:integrase
MVGIEPTKCLIFSTFPLRMASFHPPIKSLLPISVCHFNRGCTQVCTRMGDLNMANKGYLFRDKRNGKWVARISFTDRTGRRRSLKQSAPTKPEARELLKRMGKEFEDSRKLEKIDTEKITFKKLSEKYIENKVKAPEYRNGKKISGLRSARTVKIRIDALTDYFGSMRLKEITITDIETFKSLRLRTKTQYGRERSISAVNRELEVLQGMMRYAVSKGWIEKSPFENATSPIILKSAETRRKRTLSEDEETKLLSACLCGKRQHIRPLIIAGIDTGMRLGELLSLQWGDVDLDEGQINLRAIVTKTNEARSIPISDRLAIELEALRQKYPGRESVFNIVTIQKSWGSAVKEAGLDDLHFHDLRHSFCTRLLAQGMPLEEIAKISGHADINTLYRTYINTTSQTIDRARNLLNRRGESNYIEHGRDWDGDQGSGLVN